MKRFVLALIATAVVANVALGEYFSAIIVGVDAEKGIIEYRKGPAPTKPGGKIYKATVNKDCIIKEGERFLGKAGPGAPPLPPPREGETIANGLKNSRFQDLTPEKYVPVLLYTFEVDDKDNGIKADDVKKILVLRSKGGK